MAVTFFQTLQSFSQFVMNYILSGGGLVDQNTANLRAEVCAACTNNKPSGDIRTGGCGVCQKMSNGVLNAFRTNVIKDNQTTSDYKLLACSICGCDNRISVWMPNQALLGTADANAFPTYCWKKKILDGTDL